MLILTRREQESIDVLIGNEKILRFTVTKVTGDKIRIAFDAPPAVTIGRTEIMSQKENQSSKETNDKKESNTPKECSPPLSCMKAGNKKHNNTA